MRGRKTGTVTKKIKNKCKKVQIRKGTVIKIIACTMEREGEKQGQSQENQKKMQKKCKKSATSRQKRPLGLI